MSKINNPVVIILKRESSDTYAVAITNGSNNFQDAILMASMEPDMTGDDIDTWSKTSYYMAAEIEQLRQSKNDFRTAISYLRERAAQELDHGFRAQHNALIYSLNELEKAQSSGMENCNG